MKVKKNFLPPIFVLGIMLLSAGCKKDKADNGNMYNITASMTGTQEVPAVTTSGSGAVTGTYDASTNTLTYHVTWSNLSGAATLAHFHGAAASGTNASVIVPFTINSNGVSADGSTTLTEPQEADLLNGLWYANVHTAAHPSGEIRGQVTAAH
jgi:hypothetical protein